jgi:hypothetical protein
MVAVQGWEEVITEYKDVPVGLRNHTFVPSFRVINQIERALCLTRMKLNLLIYM